MSNPQQLPSFYESILFQARLNPHAVAVTLGARTISFRSFCEHVEHVTRRLHAKGLKAGSRVGVSVDEGYLRWLTVIALARLGLPSVTLAGHPREIEFVRADVVLTDGVVAPGPHRTVAVTADWVKESPGLPAFRDFLHEPDAPCRIVLSSGTTGLPKKALFTYGHLRARSRGTARMFGANASTKLLTTMGITTIGGFWTPITVWANGGSVVLTPLKTGQSYAGVLVRSRPNLLFTSTAQLGSVLQGLPTDYWPVEHLVAYVAGSALPHAINRRARLKLTESLFVIYGSTEAGSVTIAHASIADTRPDFTGFVLPTAQVEIVAEDGSPVPNGTMGEVRLRADGLVDEYLEDADAQDGSFRDGWFYPGDAGILDDNGGLSVVGRTRELMNFGGVKISPEVIETALAKLPGVEDMAVFGVDQPGKPTRPYVAVIAGEEFDDARLVQRFRQAFSRLPAISVVRVDAIPRNDMGKVMRSQMAANVLKEKSQA